MLPCAGKSAVQREETKTLIYQIKEIIDRAYQEQDVALQYTCSFARMYYPQDGVSPQDFIVYAISDVAHQSPTQLYIDVLREISKKCKGYPVWKLPDGKYHNGMMNFEFVVQPVVSAQNGLPIWRETLPRLALSWRGLWGLYSHYGE